MGQLAFLDEDKLFDGECIRFTGRDGADDVVCGVTLYALQHCDEQLPKHGLVSAESFLAAYDRLMTRIHHAARQKHDMGLHEPQGPIRIMIHRQDLAP